MNKVREGYKVTELGEIPEDWEVKALSEITSIITKGTTPTTYGYNFEDEGINFIKIESINDINGTFKKDTFSKISEECHQKLSRSIIEEKDILFAIAGATIGKCAIVTNDCLPANTNQALAIIRVNKNIHEKFIFNQLRGEIIQNKIDSLKTNTAQPNLNLKQIGEFVILLPPLIEQQKISLILTSINEKIENTDKLIERTKELKKGLMKSLLTKGIGHNRFKDTEIGRIPDEWEIYQMGEASTFINGRAYKRTEFKGKGTPIIRIQNLTGEGNFVYSDMDLEEDKYIEYGDLIYAWSATFGPFIWKGLKSIYHYHIWKVECNKNKIDKEFFYYRLHYISLEMDNQKNGSAFSHITKAFMEKHKIALPPVVEQKRIASILCSVDEQIEHYEAKKEKLQDFKKGLMQKLLTGKIRVKV